MEILETDKIIINYSETLEFLIKDVCKYLEESIDKYRDLFKLDNLEKITLNYFDNLEEFREFIYKLRGEKESLPKYATGTFDCGMVNAYLNSTVIKGSPLYNKYLTMASHELFHILYKNNIWSKNKLGRIVWYDEGMAQFYSGECNYLKEEEKFREYYFNVKNNTKKIPRLNELEHGNSFKNDEYNAYNLSYLAVRYLYDKLGDTEFKELINNPDLVLEYGDNVLIDLFEYYDKKLLKK